LVFAERIGSTNVKKNIGMEFIERLLDGW